MHTGVVRGSLFVWAVWQVGLVVRRDMTRDRAAPRLTLHRGSVTYTHRSLLLFIHLQSAGVGGRPPTRRIRT